jgi:carboxypeptidase C (cathepsin A)
MIRSTGVGFSFFAFVVFATALVSRAAEVADISAPEGCSATHHTLVLDGKSIGYEATAGTLTIRDDQDKAIASMFYVAYVADHGNGELHRPITFFNNGGPGSATIWLHLGSFGPMRIRTNAPDITPSPFQFGPNDESLLDKTDMVFLDAIGTGYSRTLGDATGRQFWSVDSDVDTFVRGISRYLTIDGRWNSPKFLFGESYGTTRSAALVYALQRRGIEFNGVVLLSSTLNYTVRTPGLDLIDVGYVPSFAAAAWYHNKLSPRPADLAAYLREVRRWSAGPYAAALAKGTDITPEETDAIARQMSAYIGVSVDFVKKCRLRVSYNRFCKELLRDEHLTIGRFDGRFKGIDADDAGEAFDHDPSETSVSGPFVAALHAYLEQDLGYHTDLAYRHPVQEILDTWDYHHKAPGSAKAQTQPDVAVDLAAAMRENPTLKVFSLNGLFDLGTPFFETEFDFKHMDIAPPILGNLRYGYYPAGHMIYLSDEARKLARADLQRFYDDAAPQ